MRKRFVVALLLTAGALYERPVRSQTVPTVRIGLTQNASTVSLRASTAFTIPQNRTRTAKFTPVLALDPVAMAGVPRANLRYRTIIELDGGRLIVLPKSAKIQIDAGVPIEFDNRSYRGKIEVFVNSRNTLTVVNELPLEEYLFGLVPIELKPVTCGEIEALKAQAVAARTYIVRNMGQYKNEGYDVCATDACQVYLGAKTEDPLATPGGADHRAVQLDVRRPDRGCRAHLRGKRPIPGIDGVRVPASQAAAVRVVA